MKTILFSCLSWVHTHMHLCLSAIAAGTHCRNCQFLCLLGIGLAGRFGGISASAECALGLFT